MVCNVRRHARLTTVACVLALGLLASACNSVPSGGGGANPLTCVPGVATPADYQKAFDQRGPVWSGGDGGVPVALPDGRILWMFGDTEVGPVVNNRFLLPGPFVHNTFIVQTGSCFEPHVAGTA